MRAAWHQALTDLFRSTFSLAGAVTGSSKTARRRFHRRAAPRRACTPRATPSIPSPLLPPPALPPPPPRRPPPLRCPPGRGAATHHSFGLPFGGRAHGAKQKSKNAEPPEQEALTPSTPSSSRKPHPF